MATEDTRRVTCKSCNAERPPELASTFERPPCPECGETGIVVHQTLRAEAIGIVDSVRASLIPGEQERNWERRWQDAQDRLNRLLTLRPEPLSSDAIHAANADLQAFYVQTYHLKDSLKGASATTGISPQTIENEITNNPDLALLADLANLDKHGHLSNPPRSGDVPKIVAVRGSTTSSDATPRGWRLDVTIEHHGHHLDGLDVAKRAVSAWERALKRWNLL
jgi:predicted RNA-binding Zn-ribbon protein involved in translation (DUF1610 family)